MYIYLICLYWLVSADGGTVSQSSRGLRVSGANSVMIVYSSGSNYIQCKDDTFHYFNSTPPLATVCVI
jgi:hypothetical protein